MPTNWSAAAMESAVENGLLKGYTENGDTYLKPKGVLTRAELTQIITNAFAAKKA